MRFRAATRLSRTAGFLIALPVVGTASCGAPLEFADWTFPVAEGVRVIEYPATAREDRKERIRLVEELVLGHDADDPNQAFYGVRDVDADGEGNLWILDGGNRRIQVFDRAGAFVRSLGREGQGPGELDSPGYVAVMGDRVLVRSDSLRYSLFDLDGEHITDITVRDVASSLAYLYTRPQDDTFLASYMEFDRSQMVAGLSGTLPSVLTISRFSLDGAELSKVVQLNVRSIFVTSNAEKQLASAPWTSPSFGASEGGDIYATTGAEYQVLAVDPDDEPKWAMRVAYVPPGLSEEIIARGVEAARRSRPETTRNDLIWPDRQPALDHIAVDGHGHVYVYPHFESGDEPRARDRPVDVYSADGELLFAGIIEDHTWRRARGDFVYATGPDPVSGETLVWCWRLEEPF